MFRNLKQVGRWMVIAVTIGLFCSSQAAAVKPDKDGDETAAYTLVDLLALPGGDFLQSDAQAISQPDTTGAVFVAGNSYTAGQWHPVLWDVGADGSFTNPLDLDAPAHLSSYVFNRPQVSVNTAGVVVERLGYVFVPGLPTQELSTSDDVDAYATAINNSDQIVGWSVYDDGATREGSGALWTLDASGVPGDPALLGDFIPTDISDTGLMAGHLLGTATAAVARFDGNVLQVTSLGVLPGYDLSDANAISSDGVWVAGTCAKHEGVFRYGHEAFVWSEATGMIGLGRLGGPMSEALGVNSAGQVVGYSDTVGRYPETAFLWQDGQMLDLNALADTGKIHLDWARDINDAGQIVGVMRLPRPVSEDHGFVLIPNAE